MKEIKRAKTPLRGAGKFPARIKLDAIFLWSMKKGYFVALYKILRKRKQNESQKLRRIAIDFVNPVASAGASIKKL